MKPWGVGMVVLPEASRPPQSVVLRVEVVVSIGKAIGGLRVEMPTQHSEVVHGGHRGELNRCTIVSGSGLE